MICNLSASSGDQHALHRNLVDRCRDRPTQGLDFDFEVAWQSFALAPLLVGVLAHQQRATRFEFLRKHRDGLAGAGDAFAMGFGFLGRAIDLCGAVADSDDEVRRVGDVFRHLAGGLVLLGHRAVDVLEHGADRLDRLRNPLHRVDRSGGVHLQRLDFPGDLLSGLLRLHRQRLDLGGHHRETAAGRACPRRLDGGIKRQQRGLFGDVRDQVDDIADR